MIQKHSRSQSRSAFTLVELMVVLLIIAILVSLLSSAVFKAMQKIPEVQTRTEIAEMSVALNAFMTDYGLTDAPPSTLILNEASPLSAPGASGALMLKMFGKNLGPTDWNGDGAANSTFILQGHQCLVFYLGGPPTGAGLQGFSTNNINPALPGGKRRGPYFTFVTSRLVPPPATAALPATFSPNFPVYVDPWQTKSGVFYNAQTTVPGVKLGGTPYAYFSSYGINNGYSYTDCSGLAFLDAFVPPRQQFALPYYTAFSPGPIPPTGVPTVYMNSNTYQIISAGKDGVFGYNLVPPSPVPPPPGAPDNNIWIPTTGAGGSGADDQTNFSSTLLGSGQN